MQRPNDVHQSPKQGTPDKRKKSLPKPFRRFVELMQQIDYGRIEKLIIRRGQPVMDPPPRVVREVKFGGLDIPRRELSLEDFALKKEVLQLLLHIDATRDGVIEVLEIKNGLPFRMTMEVAA